METLKEHKLFIKNKLEELKNNPDFNYKKALSSFYNSTYYENHKEKLSKRVKCVVCNIEYGISNKFMHNKSKRHRNNLEANAQHTTGNY